MMSALALLDFLNTNFFDNNVLTAVKTNMAQIMLEVDKGEEEEDEKIY